MLHFQQVQGTGSAASSAQGNVIDHFFHISFQTKRPWKSVGTNFEHHASTNLPKMPWTAAQATDIGHRRFTISPMSASHLSVQSLFELLRNLDLADAWCMRVWLLSTRATAAKLGGSLHAVPF